jgi:hypothetical protein
MGKHSRIKKGRRATNLDFATAQTDFPVESKSRVRNMVVAVLFAGIFCGFGLWFAGAVVSNVIQNLWLRRLPTALVQIENLDVVWQVVQNGKAVAAPTVKFTFEASGQTYISTNFYPASRLGKNFAECFATRDRLINKEKLLCWFDPQQPGKAFLDFPSNAGVDAFGGIFLGGIFVCLGIVAFMALIGFDQTNWVLRVLVVSAFGSIATFFICLLFIVPVCNHIRSARWPVIPATVVYSGWRQTSKSSKPEIVYRYSFNDRTYLNNQLNLYGGVGSSLGSISVGSQLKCYLNPAKPWQSVMNRELSWVSLLAIVPVVILIALSRISLRRKLTSQSALHH